MESKNEQAVESMSIGASINEPEIKITSSSESFDGMGNIDDANSVVSENAKETPLSEEISAIKIEQAIEFGNPDPSVEFEADSITKETTYESFMEEKLESPSRESLEPCIKNLTLKLCQSVNEEEINIEKTIKTKLLELSELEEYCSKISSEEVKEKCDQLKQEIANELEFQSHITSSIESCNHLVRDIQNDFLRIKEQVEIKKAFNEKKTLEEMEILQTLKEAEKNALLALEKQEEILNTEKQKLDDLRKELIANTDEINQMKEKLNELVKKTEEFKDEIKSTKDNLLDNTSYFNEEYVKYKANTLNLLISNEAQIKINHLKIVSLEKDLALKKEQYEKTLGCYKSKLVE